MDLLFCLGATNGEVGIGEIPQIVFPEELVAAIRKVRGGDRYISPALSGQLIDMTLRPSPGLAHDSLSAREFEVFEMLASGSANRDIAERLCLSDKTISTYRSRILEKLGIKNNAELVRYAVHYADGLVARVRNRVWPVMALAGSRITGRHHPNTVGTCTLADSRHWTICRTRNCSRASSTWTRMVTSNERMAVRRMQPVFTLPVTVRITFTVRQ